MVNTCPSLCTSFDYFDSLFLLKLLHIIFSDLNSFFHIRLICQDDDCDVISRVLLDFLEPQVQRLEALLGAHVEHDHDTVGALVVGVGYGAVAFLSSRVPNLQLDGVLVDLEGAEAEVNSDRGDVVVVEAVVSESDQQAGLSDASVSNEDKLEEVIARQTKVIMWKWGLTSHASLNSI